MLMLTIDVERLVYFSTHQGGQVNKGMVINLTPRKKHFKVATRSKERPIDVALDQLKEPPPQPLKTINSLYQQT